MLGDGQGPGRERDDAERRAQAAVQLLGDRVGIGSGSGAPLDASTYTRSGGTIGSPSATTAWRPRPGKPSSTAPIAPGWMFTARTRSMSSVRPSMRIRGVVRPHAHGAVHTVARSPER